MYYVYQHTRKDTNEVFYIGMGKIRLQTFKKESSFNTKYSRAFERAKRSNYWKNITKLTNYDVKIIFESPSLEEVSNKEIELIKKYGRKAIGEGSLCNFDAGGKYTSNRIRLISCPINQISLKTNRVIKTWKQPKEIQNTLGFLKTNIVKCCRKKQLTAYGYKWEYALNKNFDNLYAFSGRKNNSNRCRGIEIYRKNDNKLLYIARTLQEAADFMKINRATVSRCFKNNKHPKKFLINRKHNEK